VICGRRVEQINATAEEINAAAKEAGNGGEVIAIQADVGNKQGVVDFYEKCEKVIDKVRWCRGDNS
jgi:NADP-dependent 3-hydroxy acid dehydrogenase YdfG